MEFTITVISCLVLLRVSLRFLASFLHFQIKKGDKEIEREQGRERETKRERERERGKTVKQQKNLMPRTQNIKLINDHGFVEDHN